MEKKLIIVTFGELSTKGKNIMNFIRLLGKNITRILSSFSSVEINVQRDHIYILFDEKDEKEIINKLSLVPGISSFFIARKCNNDIKEICNLANDIFSPFSNLTFKVKTTRINKSFPLNSDEINREVGSYILSKNKDAKVDVHNPQVLIQIMLRENETFIYSKKEKGLGGYPVGIAGKSLHLISGGIDSPVAAFLMLKRGVELEMIHFEAPPYTSSKVIDKIKTLIRKLNIYQEKINLHIVPFTKLEKLIYDVAGPSYCVTIMRRMMLRISSIIAKKNNCLILSTGESIGQVASQTLPSINVIDTVSSLPVIRPLACYDKIEIIELAQKLDTYNTSIIPYEDCCTIFKLKDPVTHPNLKVVESIEEKLHFQELIEECVNNTKTVLVEEEKEL